MKYKILVLTFLALFISGCDKVNQASRTMDTMLGGDYKVIVQGIDEPFFVKNDKVTSIPEKGYYVFYHIIDGKERLVQSPIQLTTIIKMD
jgi:hypothetical protein